MKFNATEATFLDLLRHAGGSYCPGSSAVISKDVRKLTKRLERLGVIRIEDTDDGPRFIDLRGGTA